MEALLDSLKHGGKFADLARTYSEDPRFKDHGGDIGFIERGRTVKSFEDVVFKLKVGEVSGIIKTPFGLHIAKLTEANPVPPFAEMEQELRSTYQQRYFQKDYDAYVDKLKKEYTFTRSEDAVAAWKSSVDTAKTTDSNTWDSLFSAATRAKGLFTLAGQKITIDSVIRLVKEDRELQGLPFSNPSTSDRLLDKTSKNLVIEYKALSMESHTPDFEMTVKGLRSGKRAFQGGAERGVE